MAALFQPPSQRKFWLKTGPIWEKTGRRVSNALAGGVLIVEVTKQVYARPKGVKEAVRRPLRVLEGLKVPEAKPI